ncbi:UNVERIFIED_CONTAM: hypothetical protein FKN15_046111 [Acipenser sinensis]
MLYGYNLAVVNSPAEHIKEFYNRTWLSRNHTGLSEETLTLLYSFTVSVFAIGGLLGSLLVGMLVTKFGRKGTLVYCTVLVFIAGALMGFSRICHSLEMVIIGRFVTGIHSGICLSVVPMYLGEIAPKNLRGFLALVPSIFICLGVFLAQVLGLEELLGKEAYWPLFLSLVVVPTFIQLMLLPWFPESPRYLLIEKRNIHATITALKWYRSKCNIQAEIEEMQEEQHSLSTVETVSVWGLMMDKSMSAGSFCYLVFCGVCVLVAVYVHFVIPETKNKTFVEICQMFATKEPILSKSPPGNPNELRLKKFNGYGMLENSSVELDSSRSYP